MAIKKKATSKKKAAKKTAVKKAAPAVRAIAEKQTKQQIVSDIADETGLSKKEVSAVFAALGTKITQHMKPRGSGDFTIPDTGIKVNVRLVDDQVHGIHGVIKGDVDLFRQGLDVIARAAGKLVVGANNAVALEALADLDLSRLILVSPRLRDAVIERHLSAGGAAVIKLWNAERDRIVLYDDDQVITAIGVDPTVTRSGTRAQARRIEAKMYAVALAYSAGMTGPDIEKAIRNAPTPVPRPNGQEPTDAVAGEKVPAS